MSAGSPKTIADDRLSMTLSERNDAIWIELHDLSAGNAWGPGPLMGLEVHDATVRRTERLDKYRVDAIDQEGDRIHVIAGDADCGILLGLWLWIENGELVVRLSMPEVYERKSKRKRLFAVDLVPGLMQAGPAGQLLLPLGCGTVCSPKDKPALEDRFLLYCEQPRWELAPLLPFCAASGPRGGLMALATKGEWDTQCRVATDGQGNGTTGFAFALRQLWPDPVECNVREIRYAPMTKDDEPVHFCAKRIRRWVVEELGAPTLREKAERSPEVAYAANALVTKMAFAQEAEGLEMAKKRTGPVTYHRGMTFAQAQDGLKRLHDAGIDKLQTWMVGWNCRGHDGLYPTRFPIDERLGGESAFRELIRAGQDLGFVMNVHDNFQMNIPHAPDWDPECLTHDVYGEPLLHGWWSGGLEYQSWPSAFPRKRLQGHLERMRDLGIRGMYYVDYMMSPLEINYHPRHKGGRGEHVRGQIRVWEAVREVFGAVATEFAPLPAALNCDFVCYAAGRKGRTEWPVAKLMDQEVPVWELALHGLVIKERMGTSWQRVMHQIAFGEHPRAAWSCHNFRGNITELDDAAVGMLKALYDLVVRRFGHLKFEEITAWNAPATNVVETTFADGTRVCADYNTEQLTVNDETIALPPALKQ